MDNLSVLKYFKSIVEHLHLPVTIQPTGTPLSLFSNSLRKALGIHAQAEKEWAALQNGSQKIYYITDEFSFHYITVHLSEVVLVVGPYLLEDMTTEQIQDFVIRNQLHSDWLPALQKHYQSARYLESESMLFSMVQALGEQLWGPDGFHIEQIVRGIPESWQPLTDSSAPAGASDILHGVQLLEQRYQAENALMQAVAAGRAHTVQQMLTHFSLSAMDRRADRLRDTKNYSIILNTLMRKAAEKGGVHPLYIDRISSKFARRIESTTGTEPFGVLWSDMARDYCMLVKKHNTEQYTALVQKVITRIDFDLAADLSLRTTAELLNVNASYLCAHFKQQVGMTLTDYVNQKRMEYAAYMLSSTSLSVSAIAQSCGIQDDNYFTKVFKRYNGITPMQFRKEKRHFR